MLLEVDRVSDFGSSVVVDDVVVGVGGDIMKNREMRRVCFEMICLLISWRMRINSVAKEVS